MRAEEEQRARQWVKSSFRCDRVGQVQLNLGLSGVRSAPVYVPAFVFRSTHLGNKLRTFVSGPSSPAELSHATFRGLIWAPLDYQRYICSLHTKAVWFAQE